MCLPFKTCFWMRGGGAWLIYGPLWTTTAHQPPFVPEELLAVNQICCWKILGKGSALWHCGLYLYFEKTPYPDLVSQYKEPSRLLGWLSDLAVHWSPRATWAVQCQAGCWRAARHTRVQLLDCHITTDYLGGLLTVYAANWAQSLGLFTQC